MKNKYLAKVGSTALATLIIATGLGAPAQAASTPSPNAINTYSRAAVASAYANQWLPATNSPINWTGDAATCNAGTESADSLAKGAQALNFYRGLAGLDSVSLSTSQNATAQTTALLMEANGMINHYPDASWKCYSQLGAQGASTSNLYGGAGSFQITSAAGPIKAYMDESGANNAPVGHRRWVLNPSTVTMGMGTTKGFNALNVVGAPTDANRSNPTMIGFPGSGYFPQQLEPKGKWSVSSAQGVDFSGATVKVKDASGTALGVTPLSTDEGYGPNTLSFQVQGLAYASGNGEADYTVTVDNMKKNNLPFSYSYTVRLFDGTVSTSSVVPAEPMPTLPTTAVTVVAQSPTFGATNYVIPTTTGVVYKVNGTVTQAGTYNASTPIKITAVAASGYTLTGAATWSKDFTPVVVQPINVTPTAPTFGATTYTIPYQVGVDYKVNGGSTLQGTYTSSAPVTITAVALPGYALTGTTTWNKDYTPVVAQPIQLTAVVPTLGATSYTIPTVAGVDYLVNGSVKAAGTYTATTNITVTAVAKTGYVLSGTATWTKDFTPVSPTPTPTPIPTPSISYAANVQRLGWQASVSDGTLAGTTGQGLGLEALRFGTVGQTARGHVQNIGWQDYQSGAATIGTTGRSLRMEAIQVKSTVPGEAILCTAHVANVGWMPEVGNGEVCGTTGKGLQLESVRLRVVKQDISYAAHVQMIGWQARVSDGALAGTTGRGLGMEALRFGSVGQTARAHVQNVGWQDYQSGDSTIGTTARSLRMEAIQVKSTVPGQAILCQAHVSNVGWMPEVGDGEVCGTTGKGLQLESIRLRVVKR